MGGHHEGDAAKVGRAMRLKEQRLWDRMKRNVSHPKLFLNRIENRVGVGDPDVEALAHGVYSKVELKAVDKPPARANTPLLGDEGLNLSQRNFLYAWAERGGRSFVLIGIGKGPSAEQYLIPGRLCDSINDMSLAEVQTTALAFTWPRIQQILMGVK